MKAFTPLSSILDGISLKLNECFGDGYMIYPEDVKQGLSEPCFFIKLLNSTNEKERGLTYYRENLYCLHFFPASKNEPKAECYSMLDNLYLAMAHIEVDGNLVRSVSMRGEIHDDILLFYVNYNVFVRKEYNRDLMEVLESIEFHAKG